MASDHLLLWTSALRPCGLQRRLDGSFLDFVRVEGCSYPLSTKCSLGLSCRVMFAMLMQVPKPIAETRILLRS